MMAATTVTTYSKRKSRKRKYHQMMAETKQTKKAEILDLADNDDDDNDNDNDDNDNDNDNNNDNESQISQISIPSPSKHDASSDIDDICCNGLLLKSQKANLDELIYLIKGIEFCHDNDTNDDEMMFNKLKNLINLGLWLKHEENQLIVGGSKYIPLILDHLRNLSRIYLNENIIIIAIIANIFILHHQNINHFTDVVVNILIRFIRNNSNINHIIYSLKQYQPLSSSSSTSSSRRSRRNRNKNNKNKNNRNNIKIADDLIKLFGANIDDQHDDDNNNNIDIDTICESSLGYLSSFLLVKIIGYSINKINRINNREIDELNELNELDDEKLNDNHNNNNNNNYCVQIMDYICHPSVIYKLACIAQIDCVQLETQRNDNNNNNNIHHIENELILMELITRNLCITHKQTKLNNNDLQTEKEGLLKILDCIGLGLRFIHNTIKKISTCSAMSVSPMDCDDNNDDDNNDDDDDVDIVQDEVEEILLSPSSIQRLLILILKVLTNITNGRNVSLKPNTMHSIFFLLSYYNDIVCDIKDLLLQKENKNYQLICLILGVLINCCERNKIFRNSFNLNTINGEKSIDFLINSLINSRKLINQIQIKKENENGDNQEEDDENDENDKKLYKAYMEYKVISFYISLLLGFLLQNTANFKYIASKMNQLSLILLCLKQFLQFQSKLKKNGNTQHTVTIISKIIQIVQLRNETLKSLHSNNTNNDNN